MAKSKRVGFKLDMTPMVDVGFLLLTFFMLTTQFKPPEVAEIVLPASHSAFKLPDSDVLTITIDKDGNIFIGVDSQNLRAALFGEQNKLKAGVQVNLQELDQTIREARTRNPKLRTVIRGHRDAQYKVVQDVMDVLQKTLVTRFNLVTDLER
ncbi:MAG: biopolymer transporter ExbD [Bacteroidetes bacterium]|nr:biopolymer transporter ExbD [Bacteroidota bacterium]